MESIKFREPKNTKAKVIGFALLIVSIFIILQEISGLLLS